MTHAAEFEDSGALLDLRLHQLEQAIQELDARLHAVEAHEHDTAPVPPNPEPDPQPPEPPLPPEPPTVVLAVEPGQDPIDQHVLPTRIEAEDFDLCDGHVPECEAYFDTTSENIGGMYRLAAGVDIKASQDLGGGYQVGWVADGEWLEYTVGVQAGVYDIHARVTKNTTRPGAIDVLLGGERLGQIVVPNTGSWDANHVTVTIPCVLLKGGNQILRLEMLGGPLDLNWIEFVSADTATNDPPCDLVLEDG